MKKKELEKIAKQIARAELNIQSGVDIEESKATILKLTSKIDWQYLDQLDELVQTILNKF